VSFLTASIRLSVEPVDMTFHLIAAADTGSGNFLVGLLLGLVIGLLVGPVLRSWLIFREWSDASREAKLADRLVTRLEADAEGDVPSVPNDHVAPRTPSTREPRTPVWPTRR
jgi:hypothetical protein